MMLTTARLTLRPFIESDWPFFLSLRQNPQIMRFMADIASEAQIRTLFSARLHDANALVICDKQGTLLGDIGLHISAQHPQEADVGYAIAPFAQGKGVASEALWALCEYAFSCTAVTALNAWVVTENSGSARLLEKLGFTLTQTLEKALQIKGVDYDDQAWRLEKTR